MAYADTHDLSMARYKALKAGARYEAVTRYPHPNRGLFAYHWFDANLDEVGYWLPDLMSFTEFDPARLWADCYMEKLEWTKWFRPEDPHVREAFEMYREVEQAHVAVTN